MLTFNQGFSTVVNKIKMFWPPNAVSSNLYAMNKRAPSVYPYVCDVRQYLLKGGQNHDMKFSNLLVEACLAYYILALVTKAIFEVNKNSAVVHGNTLYSV